MRKFIAFLITVSLLVSGGIIARYWINAYQVKHRYDDIDVQALKKMNPDFIGMLVIDTFLREPVVKGNENSYYLTHTFDGKEDKYGCVFADCEYSPEDKNLVIYGHDNLNGTMLSGLVSYKTETFSREHTRIDFIDIDGVVHEYELVLAFNYTVADIERTNPYLLNLPEGYGDRLRSYMAYYDSGEDLSGNIITLSTCDESVYGAEGRIILMAKEVGS